MAMLPMAMYGLEVPCGDVMVMGHADIPAPFRVTMAAIDPSAEPEGDEDEITRPRATLKVIRIAPGDDEDSEDEMDMEDMERQFGDLVDMDGDEDSSDMDDDDDDDDDDGDVNGGPSDPAKSKQARRAAAQKEIAKLLAEDGMDMDDDDEDEGMPNGVNGIVKSKKAKGKMPASDEDEDDESDLSDDEGGEVEEFVICTLDPDKNYQQPLDITFGDRERVWFKVSGTHSIYLTGNYVEPVGDSVAPFDDDSDEEGEYDLSPDEDELDDSEEESIDDLDDMEDPRITELEEEDDEAPALVKTEVKKVVEVPVANKNKRPAPESADEADAVAGATLDEMIANEAKTAQSGVNGEQKLSKKQLKKLKKNNGLPADAPVVAKTEEKTQVQKNGEQSSSLKSDKRVTFAHELEQGPTPTKTADKKDDKPKSTTSLGVKTVQGVKIDDRKTGTGQAAKKGDRLSMRYIGKLEKDGKVFDANKKGKPFSFTLGSGAVIKGWDIGIEGMQAGAERRLTIPAHLAYGSKRNGDIPPNAGLVFDIKLLDINRGK